MAGLLDKHKKKKDLSEWSRTGSFINKPDHGWIHPDLQLEPDAGICYGVRVSRFNPYLFILELNAFGSSQPSRVIGG